MTAPQRDIVRDERSKFEFHDDVVYLKQTKRGLTSDNLLPWGAWASGIAQLQPLMSPLPAGR